MQNICSQVLIEYAKKASKPLATEAIDLITEYLFKQESPLITCKIIEYATESGSVLSEKSLGLLVNLLMDHSLEVKITITRILYNASIVQPLSCLVIAKIQLGLKDFSEEVVKYTVQALEIVFKKKNVHKSLFENIDTMTHALVDVASNQLYRNNEINVSAIMVLRKITSQSKRLKFDLLTRCIPLLKSLNDKLRCQTAQLFNDQIDHLQLSIKNSNLGIIEILDNLTKFISDETILKTILSIFLKSQNYGYRIPEDTLTQIAGFLLNHPDNEIVKISSVILKNADIYQNLFNS